MLQCQAYFSRFSFRETTRFLRQLKPLLKIRTSLRESPKDNKDASA